MENHISKKQENGLANLKTYNDSILQHTSPIFLLLRCECS